VWRARGMCCCRHALLLRSHRVTDTQRT
jgi:hypothetical protein